MKDIVRWLIGLSVLVAFVYCVSAADLADYATTLQYMGYGPQSVLSNTTYRIQDDGAGPYIAFWNPALGPQPTDDVVKANMAAAYTWWQKVSITNAAAQADDTTVKALIAMLTNAVPTAAGKVTEAAFTNQYRRIKEGK